MFIIKKKENRFRALAEYKYEYVPWLGVSNIKQSPLRRHRKNQCQKNLQAPYFWHWSPSEHQCFKEKKHMEISFITNK